MNSERRGLVVVVAVLLVSAVLGGIYGPNVRATTASADDYQTAVRDFTRVLNVVQNNYADTVDVDKAVYQGAIPGMLRMLDPHSSFFDAKQFSLLREDQRGKYYGVGMIVAPRENHTVVMAPYAGAPAYNAGIRPGDVIVKVDDKSTDGLTTTEVADMLKGPKGTVVKITISREGYAEQLVFSDPAAPVVGDGSLALRCVVIAGQLACILDLALHSSVFWCRRWVRRMGIFEGMLARAFPQGAPIDQRKTLEREQHRQRGHEGVDPDDRHEEAVDRTHRHAREQCLGR